MQCDINSLPGRSGVWVEESAKRIKCCGWVRIEQRVPQPRLAGFADGEVLPFVPRITETGFPVPGLEVIRNPAHLTPEAHVEELIPIGKLFISWTGIGNAAEPNPGSHRNQRSVNNESRVSNCEWIECILDWHTDAERT